MKMIFFRVFIHTQKDEATNPTSWGSTNVTNGSWVGEERDVFSHLFPGLLTLEPKAPRSTTTTGSILPQGSSKRSKCFNWYQGLLSVLLLSRDF